MVGNGFCNDDTNIADCNFDRGECCALMANTDHCSECECHLPETCSVGYHPLVGNGFCNDATNVAGCYDGGDCCEYDSNYDHCKDCLCFHQEMCADAVHPLVGDGFCNDETNNLECTYDSGDCCLMNVNTDYCSECNCLESGVITSPGFPKNYDGSLDLTWLIQVQMGKKIEINFLSFDLGFSSIVLSSNCG